MHLSFPTVKSWIRGLATFNLPRKKLPNRLFQAVAEMNEMEMENGKRIYVGRAQRKIERQGELRDKFEKLKEERLKRYQVSVYKK